MSHTGVKQGNNISPTCFSLFINGLIGELKSCNVGIQVGCRKICTLAYADDIVLITASITEMQILLDKLEKWCIDWRVLIQMKH